MKSKHLLLFVAAFCLVAVSSANAQLGVGMFKRPNIANIFHPVVGGGAAYERTDNDGQKSTMEMSIVGSEMVGTKQGYWMEFTHSGRGDKQPVSGKSLVTPDDFKFHKMVFMMPGSSQPVEMDMDAAQSHRETMEKDLDKWHSVGTESVTVPAGTFSCEHWSKDDGKGDVWVSSKVSRWAWSSPSIMGKPWCLLKSSPAPGATLPALP
jgi:hypothetical protein